jgi:hypothetical protein
MRAAVTFRFRSRHHSASKPTMRSRRYCCDHASARNDFQVSERASGGASAIRVVACGVMLTLGPVPDEATVRWASVAQ